LKHKFAVQNEQRERQACTMQAQDSRLHGTHNADQHTNLRVQSLACAPASPVYALTHQTVNHTHKRVLPAVLSAAACSPTAAQQQLD
jgi:hypothetical protein